MNDITFYVATKPFLILNKILGLAPFHFTDEGYKISKLNIFINITAAILYGAITCFGLYYHYTNYSPIRSSLVVTSDCLQVCAASVFIMVAWIYIALCQKKHISLLTKIISIDRQFRKIGDMIVYRSLRNQIYAHATIGALIIFLSINIQMYIYNNYVLDLNSTFNFIYYFPSVMNSAICQHVSFFILVIKRRFKFLNNHLKELRKINTVSVSVIQNDTSEGIKTVLTSLRNICYVHHELTKMIKLTNEIFGPILLFSFITSFVAIVVGLYFCSKAFQVKSEYWTDYVVPVVACSTYIITTIYICTICQSTIEEANKAGILIHKLETEDYDTKDQIEMFSLQIANEQVEYNAAGFFPVDYTLLFSIIAGVTTYLIILIQLSS